MKICIITQVEPSRHAGGGKAQYFLSQEWTKQGHLVKLIGADQLVIELKGKDSPNTRLSKSECITRFIAENGSKYDIIDVDHGLLPQTPLHLPNTLIVARSVLFEAHRLQIRPPQNIKLRTRIKYAWTSCFSSRNKTPQESLKHLAQRLSHTDLLNLTSELDIESATELGVPPAKICRFPYALDQKTIEKLASTQAPSPSAFPQLVFLGTFDYRKGCLDLAKCFRKLRILHPTLSLNLIGAKGLHQTEKQIRAFFNKEENEHLKVQMTFSPESIQELLAGQHAALFPSYYEGFPFSVQETLAAGIPTIAYDTPGAHDLLPKEWLVEAGNIDDMCTKLNQLITASDTSERMNAQSIVQQYNWNTISQNTLKCYETHLTQKKLLVKN